MAGEQTVLDIPFDNVGNVTFAPFQVVDIDGTNSGIHTTAVKLAATAANSDSIGVVYDQSKTTPSGTAAPNSGVNVRVMGVARVVADGAVTPGQYVGPSGATTAGRVVAQTRAAAGAQPAAILGRALTQAQNAGDQILALLQIGGKY